jgi:spore maturation protein CgeB
MRIVYFTHSLVSCWNHGNAHFQRGVLRSLASKGHSVLALEPVQSWSRANLIADQGASAEQSFNDQFGDIDVRTYGDTELLETLVAGADLVVVHEWTDPATVAALGRLRRSAAFMLLFHDTHHRAVSYPEAIRRYDLADYDGVLAFGATLAEIYRQWGWGDRVFVWHEAADTSVFRPPASPGTRSGAVWVGNWGDGEREAELERFLLAPAEAAGLSLDIHGVRYPEAALAMLRRYGVHYHGWIANSAVPETFAQYAMTVHVPRRFYTQTLPGIPTIRVFEALACGIPLISAPWSDSEGLFRPGEDFLVARDGREMREHMLHLQNDPAFARDLAERGLARILARHTCDIRADELLSIVARISATDKGAA